MVKQPLHSAENGMRAGFFTCHEPLAQVVQLLKQHPQFHLNRRNIWILKPSNSLRGHGIVVENDLDRILRQSQGKSCSYVCQPLGELMRFAWFIDPFGSIWIHLEHVHAPKGHSRPLGSTMRTIMCCYSAPRKYIENPLLRLGK